MNARVKYPRTPHLPGSPGRTADDRVWTSTAPFAGREVVVTEKMDGENTTIHRDGFHARTTNTGHRHPSRHIIGSVFRDVGHRIPEGDRLCGENLYARHSLAYDRLPGYFLVFGWWSGDHCHDWDATAAFAARLGLPTVPVLWRGRFEDMAVNIDPRTQEGYVVRLAGAFPYDAFGRSVAKYVRAGHVATNDQWARQWTRNGLAAPVP